MYSGMLLPTFWYKGFVHGITKVTGRAKREKPKGTRKSAWDEQCCILDGARRAQIWSAADRSVLHGLLAVDLDDDGVNLK